MFIVSENKELFLSCQNSQRNYLLKAVNAKRVAIAAVAAAVAGLLLALLGATLCIFSGAVSLSLTVSLMTVGMIILICSVILSVVFYRCKMTLRKEALSLESPARMEESLNRFAQDLLDLRTRIALCSEKSPQFKERLELLSVTSLNTVIEIGRKLRKEFYESVQNKTFWQEEVEASLQQELDLLQDNYNMYYELVLMNLQMQECLISGESYCQNIGFPEEDIAIVLKPLTDLQEEGLTCSETIFKKGILTLFEAAVDKKRAMELSRLRNEQYDLMIKQTSMLRIAGGWEALKKRYNAVIKQGAVLIDNLMNQMSVVSEELGDAALDMNLKNSDRETKSLLKKRLQDLGRYQYDLRHLSSKFTQEFPEPMDMDTFKRIRSLTIKEVQLLKQYEKDLIRRSQGRVSRRVFDSILDLLNGFTKSLGSPSLRHFLQQILNHNLESLKVELTDYKKLVVTSLPSLIVDLSSLPFVSERDREVLLQQLHGRANSIAEHIAVVLSEEMRFSQDEEALLRKLRLVFEKLAGLQESILCKKGLQEGLEELLNGLDFKSSKDEPVVLKVFLQNIEKEKAEAAGIYKNYLVLLSRERKDAQEWDSKAAILFDQINNFVRIKPLLQEWFSFKRERQMKTLSRESKKLNSKKQDSFIKKINSSELSPSDSECIRLFNQLRDEDEVLVKEWIQALNNYYEEANSCRCTLNIRELVLSYRSLMTVPILESRSEDGSFQKASRAFKGELNKIVTENSVIKRTLTKLGCKRLVQEVGDIGSILQNIKTAFEQALQDGDEFIESASSENAGSAGEDSQNS